jgi:hypothetical protein
MYLIVWTTHGCYVEFMADSKGVFGVEIGNGGFGGSIIFPSGDPNQFIDVYLLSTVIHVSHFIER